MLDRVTMSQHRINNPDGPLDLGALAESLVFYGSVHLVLGPGGLQQLIRGVGPNALVALLSEHLLHLSYMPGGFGIMTENTGTPFERHRAVTYSGKWTSFDIVADRAFDECVNNESKARKLRRRISPFITPSMRDQEAADMMNADLGSSADYIRDAASIVLRHLAPEYSQPDPFEFRVFSDGDHFGITTNINFREANAKSGLIVPGESDPITRSCLLSNVLEADAQFLRAADDAADLLTDPLTNGVGQLRLNDLINTTQDNERDINHFQERLLDGASIREAINSGSRSFSDLIEILVAKRRFREWLDDKDDDDSLLESYYEEVSKETWIASLPGKTIKWAVVGAAGIGLAAAGLPLVVAVGPILGVGAIDTFILDRLSLGWKPSHFVEEHLRPFTK